MARHLHPGVPLVRGLAVLGLLLAPVAAQACAVCGAGQDRSANAFAAITALLSLLPLGMIGAGLWVTRHNLWSSLNGVSPERSHDPAEAAPIDQNPTRPDSEPGT